MIIPEDGSLPPITRKGFAAFNNTMIIKVPEKLIKPGETCYQFATLDRSKKGERWPADQHVDVIMNAPLSKETNSDSVKKTSFSKDNAVNQKINFKNKGIFRPRRFQSIHKNFAGFSRRNRNQEPTSPLDVPLDASNLNYHSMLNTFHGSEFPYEEQSPQYNEFPQNDNHRYSRRRFSAECPPRNSSLGRDSIINPYPNRHDSKAANSTVSKEPLIKVPPYHKEFNPNNNRYLHSNSAFNNNSDFNPHNTRPPHLNSAFNNNCADFNPHNNQHSHPNAAFNNNCADFNLPNNQPPHPNSTFNNNCSDFNPHNNRPPTSKSPFIPHSNDLPPPNPSFNNFQQIPPPFPDVLVPNLPSNSNAYNANIQWDNNNAKNYPVRGHNEIRRNRNYEAFPTNYPDRQEFSNDFALLPYPTNAVESGNYDDFNNSRSDCPPPFNPEDNNNQSFNNHNPPYEDYNNQPYPLPHENTEHEQYAQNMEYKNGENVRNNFNRRNRNFNRSRRPNARYRNNQRNDRKPWRGKGGNNFSEGNNNRRGNNNYQRNEFQESQRNQETPPQFRNDGLLK